MGQVGTTSGCGTDHLYGQDGIGDVDGTSGFDDVCDGGQGADTVPSDDTTSGFHCETIINIP